MTKNLFSPTQLTVLTTDKCTAACAHCSMSSGLSRQARLSETTIVESIESLLDNGELRVVIFAGGEPTLLGETLLNSIAFAANRGLLTRLVTNASWAGSESSARNRVRALREAGLHELNISADDYHLPFVPFDNVVRAWRASQKMGFTSVVIANCSDETSTITPEYIQSALGQRLHMRYDDAGFANDLPARSADGTIYQLSNAKVQILGRAHKYLPAHTVTPSHDGDPVFGGCPFAGRSPAISANGHIVACCGVEASGNEVLDFGPAGRQVHESLRHAEDDLLINAIALLGPSYLHGILREMEPSLAPVGSYHTLCESCEAIHASPEALVGLRKHARVIAADVLAARRVRGLEADASEPHPF